MILPTPATIRRGTVIDTRGMWRMDRHALGALGRKIFELSAPSEGVRYSSRERLVLDQPDESSVECRPFWNIVFVRGTSTLWKRRKDTSGRHSFAGMEKDICFPCLGPVPVLSDPPTYE